jgi:hypothetical protein
MVSGFLMGAAPKPALPTGLCSPGAIFRRFLLKCFSNPGQRRVVQLLPPSIYRHRQYDLPARNSGFHTPSVLPVCSNNIPPRFLPRSGLPSNMRVTYRGVQVAPTAHKSFCYRGLQTGSAYGAGCEGGAICKHYPPPNKATP